MLVYVDVDVDGDGDVDVDAGVVCHVDDVDALMLMPVLDVDVR